MDKKTKTVAEAFLRIEQRIRNIMQEVVDKNPDHAKEKGFTYSATQDRMTSVVRRLPTWIKFMDMGSASPTSPLYRTKRTGQMSVNFR